MDIIESKENSLVKETKKLKEKRYRTERGEFLVEGFRFVEEALKSFFEVSAIFICIDQMDRWEQYNMANILQSSTKVHWVNNQVIKQLCSTETPQGIVAVVKNHSMGIQDKDGFYILADRLQDPGNMGTIIRTAHACGALGVIITKGTVDVYNEKTLRSSMGSIFNIPIIEDKDLTLVTELKNKGFKVVVSTLENSSDFYTVDLLGKILICVGNEGSGISKDIESMSDIKVKIPMPGGAESLNAAVAGSIMMYEALRQTLTKLSK